MGHIQGKAESDGSIFFNFKFQVFGIHRLVCLGVQQFQTSRATQSVLRQVTETGHDATLISRTHKARHVRFNHQFFLCHGLGLQLAYTHVSVVSNAHQAPCGNTLGQRKFHLHVTLIIGFKRRHKEGGLVKVLSHVHLIGSALLARIATLVTIFFNSARNGALLHLGQHRVGYFHFFVRHIVEHLIV